MAFLYHSIHSKYFFVKVAPAILSNIVIYLFRVLDCNPIILEDIVVQLEKSWVLTPDSLFRYAAVPYQDFEVFFS